MTYLNASLTPVVGLITLHRVKNYGSVLQSLATQRLLEESGWRVEVIDYWRPDLTDSIGEIADRSRWNGNPITRAAFIALRSAWARRNREVFNEFVESKLNLSSASVFSSADLDAFAEKYDAYCVGSDQVWNDDYNVGGSEPFFLSFAGRNRYCFAFASSLGKPTASEREREFFASELSRFARLSVRERSTVQVLRSCGLEAQHVLDPTIALNPNEWGNLLELENKGDKQYLLCYQLNESGEFDRVARTVAHDLRLPIRRIVLKSAMPRSYHRVVQPSVEEFVSLFKNAAHVVTDSFHGTAFSHVFNVPFNVVMPGKYGERLKSMLDLSGLEDRAVSVGETPKTSPIDWIKVNRRIDSKRDETARYLADVRQNFEQRRGGSC